MVLEKKTTTKFHSTARTGRYSFDDMDLVRRSSPVIDDGELVTLVRLMMKKDYQPPSLLEICKKHIMENFELDDVIKMKEIVPDEILKKKFRNLMNVYDKRSK